MFKHADIASCATEETEVLHMHNSERTTCETGNETHVPAYTKQCSILGLLLRSWVGMLRKGESQECSNCGACKELVEHVLYQCTPYDS